MMILCASVFFLCCLSSFFWAVEPWWLRVNRTRRTRKEIKTMELYWDAMNAALDEGKLFPSAGRQGSKSTNNEAP